MAHGLRYGKKVGSYLEATLSHAGMLSASACATEGCPGVCCDEKGTTLSNWHHYPRSGTAGAHTVAGTLKVRERLYSPQLDNERDLLVYLPPSYDEGHRRYPVIYMHDGQNLFDDATSFSGEWRVDETMEALGREGLEAIVVGIPNAGARRCDEYSPFPDARLGGGRGDAYLDFIVETVKPLVDEAFRTRKGRASTGIAGSSMGGLISLYAFFRYPTVFGFAGVLSPALWFAGRAILDYLRDAPLVPGKLCLDVGTAEGAATVADVRRLRDLLVAKGYRLGDDLLYLEERGAGHTEAAWAGRLGHGSDRGGNLLTV